MTEKCKKAKNPRSGGVSTTEANRTRRMLKHLRSNPGDLKTLANLRIYLGKQIPMPEPNAKGRKVNRREFQIRHEGARQQANDSHDNAA